MNPPNHHELPLVLVMNLGTRTRLRPRPEADDRQRTFAARPAANAGPTPPYSWAVRDRRTVGGVRMSAELLREAAVSIRASVPDWDTWTSDINGGWLAGVDDQTEAHLSAWTPTVALALADWLDNALAWVDGYPGWNPSWVLDAIAVARAYLGHSHD